ncbi:acyl-CoA dehydrogenase family protein [Caulobacter sp. 17J80-11]|uniref:acyl-CoA dehydrogenase family protein n=1 Tax=Caulobacter sp. 17J80-11 TaxID=2763502 RepID=UPI00165384D1|nr:acyl-CoA dehydrogenase [Caulobacter sp. 17J80-11]MBC6982702.1 acyl-CoA dehydrogenase family protein [Caulobacter sp. 17J80-11]
MPLLLNDEQTMLRDTARGFLAENGPVAQLRALRDRRDADGFSRELWKGFAEMGFTGILTPEAHGGLGLGHVEAGVVMEEIGRNLTPSPFLSTALLAVTALVRGGSEAHKAEHLPAIVAGERLFALAVDEHAKHGPAKTELRAERSGNGFRLNGTKTFVVDGHVADRLIVAARTAGAPGEIDGLTLFLVDPKAAGVATERTQMVDSHNAARLAFADVEVDADAVLGEVDGGWGLLESVLNVGRAAVAAEMTGAGEEAFGRTLSYLKERKQFSKAVGEFQALQHRCAHLYTELEITRSAVLKALQTLDEQFDAAAPIVAVAKARAGTTATLAAQEAVQMHGGVGMTDEFDIGFFMKRVRVAQELFGDDAFHADRLAKLGGY